MATAEHFNCRCVMTGLDEGDEEILVVSEFTNGKLISIREVKNEMKANAYLAVAREVEKWIKENHG